MKAWKVVVAGAVFLGAVTVGYCAPALLSALVASRSGPPAAESDAQLRSGTGQGPTAAVPGARTDSPAITPTPSAGALSPEARAADPSKPPSSPSPGAGPARPATPTVPPAAGRSEPPFSTSPGPGPRGLPPSPLQPPLGQRPPGSGPGLPPSGPVPPGMPLPPGGPWMPPLPPMGPVLPPMLLLPPGGFGIPSPLPGSPLQPPFGVQPPGGSPSLPPGDGRGLAPQPGTPFLAPGLQPPGDAPRLPPRPGAPVGAPSSLVRADLAYGPEGLHRLDLYLPQDGAPAPMLLFLHGGGWSIGDKAELSWLGQKLAGQGILVAVANYRLSPAVQHPAHAQDVARAAAWLYRHGAEHGGDPERLHLGGHSAGAHLAALVALDDAYLAAQGLGRGIVRGVVGIAGAAYDLDARYAATPMAQLLVPAFGKDPSRWAQAAPVRYVDKDAPPFLLVHGLNDTQAPAAGAQAFAAALKGVGRPVKLELLPGHEHGSALVAALPGIRAFVQ